MKFQEIVPSSMLEVRQAITNDYISLPLLAAYRPSGVRVSQTGLNSLLVSWSYSSSWPTVSRFFISYYQQDGGHNGSVTAGQNDNNATISGLTALTTYSIRILAKSLTFPGSPTSTSFNLGIHHNTSNTLSCVLESTLLILSRMCAPGFFVF